MIEELLATIPIGARWELRASVPQNYGQERAVSLFIVNDFTACPLASPGWCASGGYFLLARGEIK